jgi:DNA-binding CsgD family transcriptional regulator
LSEGLHVPAMALQDYIHVSAAVDRLSFQQRLVQFAERLEFGLVSAMLVVDQVGRAASMYGVSNHPSAFLESANDPQDALRDPVFKRLKSATRPFTYDQSLYVADGASDLWEHQAAFGYKTGISVALHAPGGRHFYLGVDRATPLPKDELSTTRLMADLQLLAVYAQETATRVLVPSAGADLPVKPLTPRELEVLKWAHEGKSAWATGQILGMSEHTVNYHLRNVMKKFKTSSKHIAAQRAVTLGLISG